MAPEPALADSYPVMLSSEALEVFSDRLQTTKRGSHQHHEEPGDICTETATNVSNGTCIETPPLLTSRPPLFSSSIAHKENYTPPLRQIPTHIPPNPVIIQQALDLSHSTNRNISIPQPPLREAHDILLRDATHRPLDLFWGESASGGDDLTAGIFRHRCRAVKRE